MLHNLAHAARQTSAIVASLLFGLCLGLPGDSQAKSSRASATNQEPDLLFEQDGLTYAIIDGGVYLLGPDGQTGFLGQLFDPDFYHQNYQVIDGEVFQIDPQTGRLYAVGRTFKDDFEEATALPDLFSEQRWHASSVDRRRSNGRPGGERTPNRLTLDADRSTGSNTVLRCQAIPDPRAPSKASISRNIMFFEKGDTVYMGGWFYLEHTPSIYDRGGLTLFDLETTFYSSFIGVRAIFSHTDSLAFELELPKTVFRQPPGSEVPFPTEQWVHVEAEVYLSDEDGWVRMWQDGQLVLDANGRTLPLADTIYDRFEVGISGLAQGAEYEKVLLVDEIEISSAPLVR